MTHINPRNGSVDKPAATRKGGPHHEPFAPCQHRRFKLHGETKSVTIKYEAKKSGNGYAVAGNLRINMKDFGIDQPSYMGLSVKPEVDVAVKFNAIDP